MRTLFIIPLVLMSLVSFPSWGLSMDDLVVREGLWYKKFTDVPFTGGIDEGVATGSFNNGKKNGSWQYYDDNQRLYARSNYQNGKQEGSFESYHLNGKLWNRGHYKNDMREGFWINYWQNGQLISKGHYENGEKEGDWVGFNKDGTVWKNGTGTFKNDVKVSD